MIPEDRSQIVPTHRCSAAVPSCKRSGGFFCSHQCPRKYPHLDIHMQLHILTREKQANSTLQENRSKPNKGDYIIPRASALVQSKLYVDFCIVKIAGKLGIRYGGILLSQLSLETAANVDGSTSVKQLSCCVFNP